MGERDSDGAGSFALFVKGFWRNIRPVRPGNRSAFYASLSVKRRDFVNVFIPSRSFPIRDQFMLMKVCPFSKMS